MKSISVIALEQVIADLEQQRNAAVRKVAKPFDDKILSVKEDIAKIEGIGENTTPDISVKLEKPKSNRGRKPKIQIASYSYPIKGTVLSKLLYAIREAGRFVNIKEIAHIIKTYEPSLSIDDIKLRFARHMNKYRMQKHIVSYSVNSKLNTFYGLPAWLIEGNPIESRKHDPVSVIGEWQEPPMNRSQYSIPTTDLFKQYDIEYNKLVEDAKRKFENLIQ